MHCGPTSALTRLRAAIVDEGMMLPAGTNQHCMVHDNVMDHAMRQNIETMWLGKDLSQIL
jgi:hypothetical protein